MSFTLTKQKGPSTTWDYLRSERNKRRRPGRTLSNKSPNKSKFSTWARSMTELASKLFLASVIGYLLFSGYNFLIAMAPFTSNSNNNGFPFIIESFKEVYFVTTSSLKYLGSILTGSGDSSQLGGPIRIAKISGQVAEFGIIPFISMMAYISISLGLINLFPIPLLDGGHLMFYAFEKVLGRPLSQKTQEGFFRIGMFLLFFIMFFATFNDLKDLGLF